MKAFTKKLLSWLCVMAMVLSLVPAVALPASAEETETPAIQYGTANLPDGVQDKIDAAKAIQDEDLAAHVAAGTCPICGTVEGGWTEINGAPGLKNTANTSWHFYIKDDSVVADGKNYNWFGANKNGVSLCLALLNTNTPKEMGGLIGLRGSSYDCTLNIMGNGTIRSNGSAVNDTDQLGLIYIQGYNNTVNLYGGTFIYTGDGQGRIKETAENGDTTYTPSGVISAGAITVKGYENNVVNIFDGVNIGPKDQDLTKPCFNVVVYNKKKSVTTSGINMYGGTIRNGVSNLPNTSGNVHLHYDSSYTSNKPAFYMYGGTISGGAYVEGTASANGANVFCAEYANFQMYGGTVTGGKTADGYGGNIYGKANSAIKIGLYGGTIENGEAKNGGNIYLGGSNLTLEDTALVQNGKATQYGGNIYFSGSSISVNGTTGGKVAGGEAGNGGGNIYTKNKLTKLFGNIVVENGTAAYGGNIATYANKLTIDGNALIQNGTATDKAGGGNIYGTSSDLEDDETIYIANGTIRGGKSTHAEGTGGNLRVNNAMVQIYGNSKIEDGEANGMGGNIFIQSKCNMSIYGNAIISGGKTNADGGNIALNSGTLTVKGNVQIKDGRATRYEINEYVDDKGKTKQEEAFVADGGNIYCYGSRENVYVTEIVDGVETQVKKTVYYNELTIQDNVVISGGWAVRGGNIAAEDTTVNIGSGVTIKDGLAGILVGDEMTYDAGIGTASRGGNIYHNTTNCPVNIAATLSGGVALHGGNLSQYSGTITFSGIMENGYAYGNGGNAVARSGVLNLEGAELRNAISVGQGGNLRAYEVEINMNGGKIYGGDDLSANNSDNVWLVASTLNMSGDATVIGGTEKASGVRMVPYNNKISVLTLADNATVVGTDGAPNVVTIQENDAGKAIVYIEEGWAGTAQVATTQAYTYGDTISNESLVVGNFAEDGTFVKGGTYSGQLYRDVVPVYGVEGDVVMPNAAIVAEDGTETIYRTNAEALAAYTYDENGYVILGGAIAEIPETIAELNVDIAGHEVTFSGNAKVNAIDSANNSFVKNGKLIIAEGSEITVETVIERNDKRYIALQDEEGAWSFHRVIVRLNTVTLRTEGAGIYYKAVYYCDETLRDLVDSYGVALSVTDMPGADFETADKYTAYTGEDFAAAYEENRVYTISGAVTGIWKERNTCERNDANADVKIYANPYLKLNIGAEGMLIMADGEDAYSLNDTLAGVNENWAGYEAEEQSAVTSFLDNWFMFLTEETAEQLQATLTNIFPAA